MDNITLPGRCPICQDEVQVEYKRVSVPRGWVKIAAADYALFPESVAFMAAYPDYPVHIECSEAFAKLKVHLSQRDKL